MAEGSAGSILVLPIIDWDFRTQRPQHLARHFASAGHRVLYAGLHLGEGHLREVETNIFRFQLAGRADFVPYREALRPADLAGCLATLDAIARTIPLDGLWIIAQLPAWLPLAMAARERFRGTLLFDCMDDFAEFGDHHDLGREEQELGAAADLVAASSGPLFHKLRASARRLVLVRNGCEPDHFLPPDAAPPPPPVIGFFGAIADWFDGELLAAVARRRPDWRFRLIGDTYLGEVDALRALGNVEFLGELPYAALPSVAASFHVGIVPFRPTPLTRASDPVKVYEMLALGLAVVATPLPELERFRPHVRLAADADAFEREIERALGEPFAARAERRAAVQGESWAARGEELRRAMNEVPGASFIRPRDLWRERGELENEVRRSADQLERLAREARERRDANELLGRERDRLGEECDRLRAERQRLGEELERFRADRDAVADRLDAVTSTRWWSWGERYWRLRRRLRL